MASVRIPAWYLRGREKGYFVRRAKRSPSFRETGVGSYYFMANGRKVRVKARAQEDDQNEFSILLLGDKGRVFGEFCISDPEDGSWFIWHRIVNEKFRLHGLGKLGLRLVEQEARKKGVDNVAFYALRKDELAAAIELGYAVDRYSRPLLNKILGRAWNSPLPEKRELANLLKKDGVPYRGWGVGKRGSSERGILIVRKIL